jgi:hypothetical protein
VVRCLRDFYTLRPQEMGWAAAIVLYEKQQVVIRQKDGPCRVTTLLRVGDTYALVEP